MNKKPFTPALSFILQTLIVVSSVAPLCAQQSSPQTSPPPSSQTQSTTAPPDVDEDDDVVRITTNLVQIDAVVTDRSGKLVTDLQAEDFEIYENNKPQPITNFSYINTVPAAVANAAPVEERRDKNAVRVPVPPARLRPEQVRRTFALVVDDLGLSFESAYFVRQGLKKFVDEQMQPNDLIAIIRTRSGVGALQQFTADKRQLYAAIERVRWFPSGRGGISAFGDITNDPLARAADEANGGGSSDDAIAAANSAREDPDDFRESIFTVGTLGALNYVVRGMRELPGRKSVVLFSDGFQLFRENNRDDRVLIALRRLTDLANRASVVVYTIDARGLQTLGLTAADDTSGLSSEQLNARLEDRRRENFETQDGLNYLAQQTGGFFIRNTNDIAGGVRRVLRDQEGYYLLGYRPDAATFDAANARRFNRIEVKLKRPGLRVRTRTGFLGVTDENATPVAPRTREAQIVEALTSPFSKSGVELRLTSLFTNDPKSGSYLRSLLYIGGRDLQFTKEADGWHKTVFDVVALMFNQDGKVVDQVNRMETVRVRGEQYDIAQRSGFTYTMNVPLKQPGAYQFRVAVRDTGTSRTGSASQFIEVPNIKKNNLALSGLVVLGTPPSATAANAANASIVEAEALPAVRRFRPLMEIDYGYLVYNAKLDKASGQPQIETQARLYREGQLVFTGRQLPLNTNGQPDLKRLPVNGRLKLGTDLTPGEYVLQVVVTDLLAKGKNRIRAQVTDFEIVK
ncbi:MAG: VWA domain-containing protein [Pyrinomonadaceae bacterium MAG19_C2-C3]|nr:VWA domain-containing protein [Pyrinomonadaceae bacterium MAG19_C2-C3]